CEGGDGGSDERGSKQRAACDHVTPSCLAADAPGGSEKQVNSVVYNSSKFKNPAVAAAVLDPRHGGARRIHAACVEILGDEPWRACW
ncbi:MAG TPA: hypothetical protein VIL72_08065, partial [Beijerinckiaceae bacterium]